MRKLLRAGVLAVALLGLLGSTMSPAHATTAFSFTFDGAATTGPLGYPCAPAGTTTNCPPPVGNGGNTVGFSFSSNTCVGEKTDIAKPDKGTKTYTGLCTITAAGTLTGYCGSSTGGGSGTIRFTDAVKGNEKIMSFTFTWTSATGLLAITGTSNKGPFTGAATATPNPAPGIGSCTDKTATSFIVAGEVTGGQVTA